MVVEASVVGVPDEEWGEVVIAVLVCEGGMAVEISELDALCNAGIARFKRPKRYVFEAELPGAGLGPLCAVASTRAQGTPLRVSDVTNCRAAPVCLSLG